MGDAGSTTASRTGALPGHRADWLELLRRKGDAERVRERIASLMETADNEAATAASGGAGS